jgi:aryl-alcohol dehydrogenase
MEITAAVVREAGAPFVLETLTLDDPQPDEVVVRVAAVGICHTDLAVQHGHIPVALPAVLGHEGAGTVMAVGTAVTSVRPGAHVIMSQALCGHCRRCTSGEAAYCEHAAALSLGGRREDGSTPIHGPTGDVSGNFVGQSSFATHAVAKARNVYEIAPDLPLSVLAPIGCGVMTGAGAIFNDARPQPGASVVVMGCGTVGLAAIMAARVAGAAHIVGVDVTRSRLELATTLGATATYVAGDDVVTQVHELTGGGADIAIEATGVPEAAVIAVRSTHATGHSVIVGAAPFGSTLELDWRTLAAGRRVQGSVIGSSDPSRDLPRLVDLWQCGDLPLETLETMFAFPDINTAVEAMASGTAVKPILLMEET